MTRALPVLLALAACGPQPDDADEPASDLVTSTFALQTLDFAREDAGVTRGFNLDGQDGGCETADFTTAEGAPGIDNNFATLLPVMEQVGGAAFEDLIQGTVDSGEFLLLARVVEDGSDCARLEVFRATEPPLVGADGALLAHQTVPVGEPLLTTDCATYEDERTLVAAGLFLPLELEIFDAKIALGLDLASVRVHLEDDGTAWGEAGGAVEIEELWGQIGVLGGIGTQLLGVLESLLFLKADVAVDEQAGCTHMSAVLAFEATPAFLFEPAQ